MLAVEKLLFALESFLNQNDIRLGGRDHRTNSIDLQGIMKPEFFEWGQIRGTSQQGVTYIILEHFELTRVGYRSGNCKQRKNGQLQGVACHSVVLKEKGSNLNQIAAPITGRDKSSVGLH